MSENTAAQQSAVVEVYFGDPLQYGSEKRAVAKIRSQLERRGISARLLVNFYLPRGERQIDLVIVTADRCVLVELKSPDMTLPLVGTVNGPWQHVLPDGSRRPVDGRNYFIQARDQTYRLSGAMHALARSGRVAGPLKGRFFEQVETLICVAPRIPEGSTFPRFRYVDVIGLGDLVDRVARTGRGLSQWTRAHWDEFILERELYAEGEDDPAARQARAAAATLEDYRWRFRKGVSTELVPLVPATARVDGEAATVDAGVLAHHVGREGLRVFVTGESGLGKTHLVKHTAVRLSDNGQLVLWVSADDYRKNDLGLLLAKAVTRYSTEPYQALLQKATDTGAGITVVVDALQASRHTTDLLQQLQGLLLAWPVSVVVTSQTDAGAELLDVSTRVELCPPADEERDRLASSYGAAAGVANSEEFRTRFDIALAAQVAAQLPPGSPRTDVIDAYIGEQTGSEMVRAGLRVLAGVMDAEVVSVLPVAEARAALRRCEALAGAPAAIDDVLESRLVTVRQGRLRFRHERLGRFLAAEWLVVSSTHGAELGRALREAAHRDLQTDALILERDASRRHDALCEIGNPGLFVDAVRGVFGQDTARQVIADITALLVEARIATADGKAVVELPDSGGFFAHLRGERVWSECERALLGAAGTCVLDGIFVEEVCELFDATDEVLRREMVALQGTGHRMAVSTVFAAAYAVQFPREADALPATYVSAAADKSRSWVNRGGLAEPAASRVWMDRAPSWGRAHLAALMSRPIRHPDDAWNLPDLIRAGWRLGGYHLRLELLESARYVGDFDDEVCERMVEVLNELDTSYHVMLSSLRVEVLARYGQIEPIRTLESIQAEIADVLADVKDPERQIAARGVVGAMFDDEEIVGPYGEAIYGLPLPQRLDLFAMSVLAPGFSATYDLAMTELAEHAEQGRRWCGTRSRRQRGWCGRRISFVRTR